MLELCVAAAAADHGRPPAGASVTAAAQPAVRQPTSSLRERRTRGQMSSNWVRLNRGARMRAGVLFGEAPDVQLAKHGSRAALTGKRGHGSTSGAAEGAGILRFHRR